MPIITLSFAYIEPRHRFGLLTDELMDKIVEARARFYEGLPHELEECDRALRSGTLHRRGQHHGQRPVRPHRPQPAGRAGAQFGTSSATVLDELGLYDDVLDVGLGFNVGAGGKRLTGAQRQKLDVARALLKRPDFLILNRPLSALDQRSQEQILKNVLEEAHRGDREPAIIWVLTNPAMAQFFDRVVVFETASWSRTEATRHFWQETVSSRPCWHSGRRSAPSWQGFHRCSSRTKWECCGGCRCSPASSPPS